MKKFVKENIIPQSKDELDFYNRLYAIGLTIYLNKEGVPHGVRDGQHGRKYTFQSMGIDKEDLNMLRQRGELNRIKDRLTRLEKIRTQNCSQEKEREL